MRWLSVLVACFSFGCGGGGAGSDSSVNPFSQPLPLTGSCDTGAALVTRTTASNLYFQLQPTYKAGQAAALLARVTGKTNSEVSYRWSQTAGSDLEMIGVRSGLLATEFPAPGNYSFQVVASSNGFSHTEQLTISVSAQSGPMLNLRGDKILQEGQRASFRIDRVTGNVSQVTACLLSGSSLGLTASSNGESYRFVAPEVASDQLFQLQLTAIIDGVKVQENIHWLVSDSSTINSLLFRSRLSKTFAYNPASTYASQLESCIYSNQLTSSCRLNQLPLLGQVKSSPTVQDILDRLIVSHQWMGDNFKTYLQQMDTHGDFAQLFKSVTAIVISDGIIPAFYTRYTGAIYLDPRYLWLTANQRESYVEATDYRSDFGRDLQFRMIWRYVKDNQYVSRNYPPHQRQSRTLNDMSPGLARLLYHELAHANDYFPAASHSSLTASDTVLEASNAHISASQTVSNQLVLAHPLTSTEMSALARVQFRGYTASATQQGYSASDVSGFFSPDLANDFYNYTSIREDTAMLFEEAMMSYRYGIQRDVAVVAKPAGGSIASNPVVNWGQRGRIGDSDLQSRAVQIINQIFPAFNGQQIISGLPEPISMTSGNTWGANLGISSDLPTPLQPQSLNSDQPVIYPYKLSGQEYRVQQ